MSEGLRFKLRRDLGRWSRKLLLCIGLESIGSELVGERNWRHLYPLASDWERDKESPVSDFDPTRPTFFNANYSAQDSPFPDLSIPDPSTTPLTEDADEGDDEDQVEERYGSYDNLAHLLPYWYFFNRAFEAPSSASLGGPYGNISYDLNGGRGDSQQNPFVDTLDPQQLNALFLLYSLKQEQDLQLQQQVEFPEMPLLRVSNLQEFEDPQNVLKSVRRTQRQRIPYSSSTFTKPTALPKPSDFEEQPLDLTNKNKRDFSERSTPKSQSQHLLPPEVTSSNSNGRDVSTMDRYSKLSIKSSPRAGRGYTSQELEAALNDIQSGKLGTRRAAVIYGIPRSTLRNKVYKLDKDRGRPYRLKDKLPLTGELDRVGRVMKPNERQIDIGPTFPLSKGSAFSPVPKGSSSTSIRALELGIGAAGSGDEIKSEEEISHEKKALKEWLQSKLSRQRLSTIEEADGIEYLGTSNGASNILTRLPVPGALAAKRGNTSETSSADCSEEGTNDLSRNELTGTPLSLDTNSYDTPRQRLKRRFYDDDEPLSPTGLPRVSPPASTVSPKDSTMPDWKTLQIKDEIDDDCSLDDLDRDKGNGDFDDGNMSDGDGNGKKSRPKRGKYRNYDRDALVKAVKAVQNGEMSVHRAGSHFGVPHSTLEYKVKERHLLRRPTRKDRGSISMQGNGSSQHPSQKSSPESSLSGSEVGTGSATPIPLEFVAPTTRETLTRFLNEATSNLPPRRRSSEGSPDSGSRALRQRLDGGRNSLSPRPFQLNDLLRRNLDNSTQHMTKS